MLIYDWGNQGTQAAIQLQIYVSGNAREPDPTSGLNVILRIRPGGGMSREIRAPGRPSSHNASKRSDSHLSPCLHRP